MLQASLMPDTGGGDLNTRALEADLRQRVQGEVRFDDGSRALYAADASNYRQVPIGVVIPRHVDDVIETVAACRRHGAPVLSRGGGTSLCGQTCNVAVVIDFSKHLNQVLEIHAEEGWARVQPGVVLDELREQANKVGLTFAPDPATHTHNTLGGMLGNNSCGPHSVMGGETVHNVIDLDILTYDGTRLTLAGCDAPTYTRLLESSGRAAEIVEALRQLGERYAEDIRARFPPIPRRVSGYNLPALLPGEGFNLAQALVGTEGTCAVILEAKVRLLPNPKARSLLVLGYEDVYSAADHVTQVMEAGPIALEGLDDHLVEDMRLVGLHPRNLKMLPEGKGWLLVEFGGDNREEADAKARVLMARLKKESRPPEMRLVNDSSHEKQIWKVRESGLGATAHVPNRRITWEGWEDSSVPPARLGEYLRALRKLFDQYGFDCALYGHFGQGCVHTRIQFDLETADGVQTYRRFIHEAAELVTRLGGSVSGEHGDGQSKAELLPIMFGERLMQAFREFKSIWDPDNKMNPGKIVNAYRADENLRLGTSYNPSAVKTMFFFRQDQNDFGRTMLRCVGVGECRKHKGTMCPSYMATGEEMHSTRGRAHLLFEMLNGERPEGVLHKGWEEPAVKEALDLCLSCKACKHECPVSVDMASYKAEFLYHYHQHHRRAPAAMLFGHIDRWARLASHAPGMVNALARTPALAWMAKKAAGIAPQRTLPVFASETFLASRRKQGASPWPPGTAPRGAVILWVDTFNNHFHPQVARAAFDVLTHAGFEVRLPPAGLCCGRPLYEFGLLDQAREKLASIVSTLAHDIKSGIPVVGLEPACVSVFKEELPMLLPHDEQARRLKAQTWLLPDFLEHRADDLSWPKLQREALVHGHCHHKTVLGFDAEMSLLHKLGLDVKAPDTGCCGMAGSYGFEAKKYDVSMACAERVLLPAVRSQSADALLIADGYSCREQIQQSTQRQALHVAEVLRLAIEPSAMPAGE